MLSEILASLRGEVKEDLSPRLSLADLPAPDGRAGWCTNCDAKRILTRSGGCMTCGVGPSNILPLNFANKCGVCGGGYEEGPLFLGKVHVFCIPSFIRAEGQAEAFARRLR